MEIGIIAEGKGDCAVLSNILQGILDVEAEDIRFLRPEFSLDNTDKAAYHNMQANEFGSWTLVKKDCEEQFKFRAFLDSPIAGERYIVVQIDTAECEQIGYDIARPNKQSGTYSADLLNQVKNRINEWLNDNWQGQILYAICIEETEAWVHALYENRDTSKAMNAKEKFNSYVRKLKQKDKTFNRNLQRIPKNSEFAQADFLSTEFRKMKSKRAKQVYGNNESLRTFVLSVEQLRT